MRESGTAGSRKLAALHLLIALAAVGGLTVTVLLDLPVPASPFAASDFKTLYASAWCFRHGLDAYSFANLAAVFRAQGIITPASWFGHAPVYPPTAVAVLAPLTWLSMVQAAYLVTIVSALLFAFAVAGLLQSARDHFALTLPWRAVIAILCTVGPLLAFALSVGNLSVAASALCLLAFVRRLKAPGWIPIALLAMALLLKPHLAIWMAIAFVFSPQRRPRQVALAASGTAIVVGLGAGFALARAGLLMQIRAFFAMVQTETAAGGSMSVSSHELLPVVSQVTSLRSLFGFWGGSAWASLAVPALILVAIGIFLARRSLRSQGERETSLITGAWIAFGLLTTYHRAHDALLLLVLAPWLVQSVRCEPNFWKPWAILLLYGALSFGPSMPTITHALDQAGNESVTSFVLLRQAGLADLGLLLVLLLPQRPTGVPAVRNERRRAAYSVT